MTAIWMVVGFVMGWLVGWMQNDPKFRK